jgi:hypothetical protein
MPTNAAQGKIYSNCSIYHPDGSLMCHCAEKRMRWYLKRGLAEKIDESSIKLLFEPAGRGHDGDNYYLEQRVNQCVVCGTKENLTKHHVVPYQYRKNMPEEYKNHTHFDVLCVCSPCHAAYEEEATKLNKQLAADLDVNFHVPVSEEAMAARKASGYIGALREHGHKIPEERVAIMLDIIGDFFEREITLADLEDLVVDLDGYDGTTLSPGKKILEKWFEAGKSVQEFVVMWRQHFLDISEPKHMSEYWLEEYQTRSY